MSEQTELEEAIQCAKSGNANHWPTVAGILAHEIEQLRTQQGEAVGWGYFNRDTGAMDGWLDFDEVEKNPHPYPDTHTPKLIYTRSPAAKLPMEPTEAMLQVGRRQVGRRDCESTEEMLENIWRYMLKAAQEETL